jgi:hypothetical protein
MKIYTITIAYAPAVAVARSLVLYQKYRAIKPHRHIVVQGHYPINEKKNTNDIKLIAECFDGIEVWDPGKNLGSAQSQNYALNLLDIGPDDYFINLDPDSACFNYGWDKTLQTYLTAYPDCVLVSCMAPMIRRYKGQEYGISGFQEAKSPTPFNLSMWKYSFIKQIGGIPQMGLWWGETEGPFFSACKKLGKFHAYALDLMENEDGKFMQDAQHNEYKNFHMRTTPDKQFLGSFDEYLRWKYPALAEVDTCKDLSDHNHP